MRSVRGAAVLGVGIPGLLVNKRIEIVDPDAPPPVLPHPLEAPDQPATSDSQMSHGDRRRDVR